MSSNAMSPTKAPPDWEVIERSYRAGLLSVREIAASQGITHGAINKRAKRDSWTRDLKAKIKAKADSLVSKDAVSTAVSTAATISERAEVEANAKVIADIRLAHRKDITRSRGIVNKLLDELEGVTDNRELFEQLGEFMRSEDDTGADKRNDLYMKVIELPTRTKTMKDLADSLKTLIGIERQAYDLDAKPGDPATPFVVESNVGWANMPLDLLKAVEAHIASESESE